MYRRTTLLVLCLVFAVAISVHDDSSHGAMKTRKARCIYRHQKCHAHCLSTVKDANKCKKICRMHMLHRACNSCGKKNHKCKKARKQCLHQLRKCQRGCSDGACKKKCRCPTHAAKHTGTHRPNRKKRVKKCAKGLRGKACRRGRRCIRRHKACHKHCMLKKTKKQCRDICFKHAKARACNRCHDMACRAARKVCFVSLKGCQQKCSSSDVACQQKCRCSLKHAAKHATVKKTAAAVKKPAVTPATVKKYTEKVDKVLEAHTKAPKVVKAKVAHSCPCVHRARSCTPVKRCNLRDTKPIKTCIKEERKKVVMCECVKKNTAGTCIEKKMAKVCVKKDAITKKCVKEQMQCVPSCAARVCEQKDPTTHKCLQYKCTKLNTHEEMKCSEYAYVSSHKCKKAGFSHKCTWKCLKRGCATHELERIEHPVTKAATATAAAAAVTAAKPTVPSVKVLDNKGHQYTDAELAALKKADPKAFNNIITTLHTAEGAAKTPQDAFQIKTAENKIEAVGR